MATLGRFLSFQSSGLGLITNLDFRHRILDDQATKLHNQGINVLLNYWGLSQSILQMNLVKLFIAKIVQICCVFLGHPVYQCEHFHKNGGFSLPFCNKTEQCERGLNNGPVSNVNSRSYTYLYPNSLKGSVSIYQ